MRHEEGHPQVKERHCGDSLRLVDAEVSGGRRNTLSLLRDHVVCWDRVIDSICLLDLSVSHNRRCDMYAGELSSRVAAVGLASARRRRS